MRMLLKGSNLTVNFIMHVDLLIIYLLNYLLIIVNIHHVHILHAFQKMIHKL